MRIMFWNTKGNKDINEYVVSLVKDYNIDILLMAEYYGNKVELEEMFRKCHQRHIACTTIGCDRISIWSNYVNMKSGIQNTYYSIQIIKDKYILCCIHLMSDIHGDRSNERFAKMREIIYDINSIEKEIGSKQTIITGDFNEMPYDRGCLSADGFHGLPVLNVSDTSTRKVNEKEYRKFYNPMWNFMGDFSHPPGTYYLNQAKLYSPIWYMLDQVILSKDILPLFRKESLKIITSCHYSDLMDRNGHPNKKISDHFPIMYEIEDR